MQSWHRTRRHVTWPESIWCDWKGAGHCLASKTAPLLSSKTWLLTEALMWFGKRRLPTTSTRRARNGKRARMLVLKALYSDSRVDNKFPPEAGTSKWQSISNKSNQVASAGLCTWRFTVWVATIKSCKIGINITIQRQVSTWGDDGSFLAVQWR